MDGTIGQSGLYAPLKNNELPDLYAYYGVLTKLVTISRILEILLIFVQGILSKLFYSNYLNHIQGYLIKHLLHF